MFRKTRSFFCFLFTMWFLILVILDLYFLDILPNPPISLAGEEEEPMSTPPLRDDKSLYEQEAADLSQYQGEEVKRHYEQNQRLRTYCSGRRKEPDNETLGHLYVFEKHKLIFCLVPKVASRQWMSMLGRYRVALGYSPYGPTVKQFPPDKASHMLKTFYKFMFVREPFERLLSAYKDKFLHPRPFDRDPYITVYARKIIANFRPNASKRALDTGYTVTFPEFIQYIINLGVREGLDWHWGRYDDICGVCDVKYDYVGHYESLEGDAKYVLQRANLSHLVYPSVVQTRTKSQLNQYYSQIPQERIVRLGEVFKSNFEMFGYHFPGPLEGLLKP